MSDRQSKLAAALAAIALFWLGCLNGAERLVDYVSPYALATNDTVATVRQGLLLPGAIFDDVATRSTARPTSGDRWEGFEIEFGLSHKNPSLVLGSIQSAKYQLDRATFAIQEFTHSVEDALKFDYGIADLVGAAPYRRAGSHAITGNMLRDSLEHARFKSDIRLNAFGESFVGVKLQMPFGD
jgi:hypothetical protein